MPADGQIVDLAGRVLVPGFHDAHLHLLHLGIQAGRLSLASCRSRAELADTVRAARDREPTSGFLIAENWDETVWDRPVPPDRALLDEVVPDRPLILRRVCGHAAVANSPALRRLRETWGGAGVDFATGVLLEAPVLHLDDLFPPGADESRRAFAWSSRHCLARGVTTASDFLRPRACRAYRDVLAAGDLPLRVNAWFYEECLDEPGLLETLPATDRFALRGLKLFADGSIGARTAALAEDYAGSPGRRGSLLLADAALAASLQRAHAAGWAVAIHAIGDRAITQVLDAFAALPPAENRDRRHRIEHLELPRPADVRRLGAVGVRPCMQPNFSGRWGGPGGLYEQALGPARLRASNPFRTVLEQRCGLFFGSDGMPVSPLFGIRSALNHPTAAQRLTFAEALDLYTVAGARAVRGDDRSGRLAAGCDADLAVLADLGGDEVALTVVAGRVVHGAPDRT
jgi:predicted amidohydrolase YtcJ